MSAAEPRTVAVDGLRMRPARHRRSTSSTRSRSRSRPARCSASSASRARARRPSAWRCSATRAAAPRSPAGRSCVGDGDVLHALGRRERRSAARQRRLVRAAGPGRLAQPGAADRHAAARGARGARLRLGPERARATRIAEMMREVALPDDAGLPAPLPARALGRPAAAHRPRDGVRVPPAPDRARRADHRPRRDDAGARARRPCASWRPLHDVAALYVSHDLAVVGTLAARVGGHVRRADRRARADGRSSSRLAPPPVHAPPRRSRSRTSRAAATLVGIPGRAPVAGQPAVAAAPSRRAARSSSDACRDGAARPAR